MESRAGEPHARRRADQQAESTAATVVWRWRSSPATAAAAGRGRRRQRDERITGGSSAPLHRPGRAADPSRSDRAHAPRRACRGQGLVIGIVAVVAALMVTQGAEVTAGVDRTHLRAGEELTLTIRARSRASDPVEILVPPLDGCTIGGRPGI